MSPLMQECRIANTAMIIVSVCHSMTNETLTESKTSLLQTSISNVRSTSF